MFPLFLLPVAAQTALNRLILFRSQTAVACTLARLVVILLRKAGLSRTKEDINDDCRRSVADSLRKGEVSGRTTANIQRCWRSGANQLVGLRSHLLQSEVDPEPQEEHESEIDKILCSARKLKMDWSLG